MTLRDTLAWAHFVALSLRADALSPLSPATALVHGARLALLDGLGASGSGVPARAADSVRTECNEHLRTLVAGALGNEAACEAFDDGVPVASAAAIDDDDNGDEWRVADSLPLEQTDSTFGIAPFRIARGAVVDDDDNAEPFSIGAPTTWRNCRRVLRALQLRRPILLEGSPGVGKRFESVFSVYLFSE